MTTQKSRIGARGEALAAAWLEERGYRVIGRNVRAGRREIDLICQQGDLIVFVEVKSGGSVAFGDPVYRVDRRKRQLLIAAALRWLAGHPRSGACFRFDVISVHTDNVPPLIEHRPAAFTSDDV